MQRTRILLEIYHWRELPQVSFLLTRLLSRQKYIIGGSEKQFTKLTFVTTKKCLSRQNYVCYNMRYNIFVATIFFFFFFFGRAKHTVFDKIQKPFVTTNTCLSRQIFVGTRIFLSRQMTCFVVTNTCLSRQK